MKLKLIALGAGILLSLMTLNGGMVNAQTPGFPALAGIELTPQQKTQITQLHQQTRAQIEQILTPQQREQLKTVPLEGQDLQTAIAALNLTPQQKDQLRPIFTSVRSQINHILTPEQQQQLRSNVRKSRQKR